MKQSMVVTGASTGIGYSVAKAFLKAGYRVYGSVRKQADADRLQAEWGQDFRPLIFDVRDQEAVEAAAAAVEAELGGKGLACLVNNAGIATSGPLMHQPLDDLRYQLEVNVVALVGVTQAFLPLLGAKKNPGHAPGRIINISSVSGKLASPFMGAYSASKHAVEAISDSMRRELMLYGIDVIVIGPGAVKTPIWEKASATDLSPFEDTDYRNAIEKMGKYIQKVASKGLDSDRLGEDIRLIFEKRKPKVRYTFSPEKLRSFVLPVMMPKRMVDRVIAKNLGLERMK